MLKNKKVLIIIGAVVLIILVSGAVFLSVNKTGTKIPAGQTTTIDTGPINISPDEVGFTLASSPDKKKIQFVIGRLDGIKAIAYELTYEAESTDQEQSEGGDPRIQRGITGEAKIKSGESTYKSPWLDLGSCSKNVCKYDQGVTSVDLILKITKENNKVYSTEQKLDL